ncbi:MAG: polyphosphate kinase 1 [Caldithrix sp.]|nr:MAG: polyphosphate kinase 1 [Caldithrix sp.]
MKIKIQNKEISWLAFNGRVLQEGADTTVPLLERIKFLGIFSSNLDEFFRVRVANLKRLVLLGKKAAKILNEDPNEILKKIQETILTQQTNFQKIYQQILGELEQQNIIVVDEKRLNSEQAEFVRNTFRQTVRPRLVPLMINGHRTSKLKDGSIYLAIRLLRDKGTTARHALIEIPTDVLPRFLTLPPVGASQYIMFLDDVIRYCLADVFAIFKYDRLEAYSIKLTRDAELDINGGLEDSYMRKISKGLEQRKSGRPVRFGYDSQIPESFLRLLVKKLRLNKVDSDLISESRYLNLKDLIDFPNLGSSHLQETNRIPLSHRDIESQRSFFKNIKKRDILLHYPYQTFAYVIDFLREAAIDPRVTDIKMTLYRVANNSNVINALINAAKNGKTVTVVMELQARFDEEPNIQWSEKLEAEGVKVIYGMAGVKVHAKMILISRKEKKTTVLYANLATGNFNEATALVYSDHGLFTADPRITNEVQKVFEGLEAHYKRASFRHLLVSPSNMRQKLIKLIDNEISNARNGKQAYMIIKLNNLVDEEIIKKLYKASNAGVKIKLMVRGMFSLIPQVKGLSENIQAKRLVDKFLEHTRLFVFCAGGEEKYYLSSADWMPRNLDSRVEVACPIYDKKIQREIKDFLNLQWQDNVKASIMNSDLKGKRDDAAQPVVRAQYEIYTYLTDGPRT